MADQWLAFMAADSLHLALEERHEREGEKRKKPVAIRAQVKFERALLKRMLKERKGRSCKVPAEVHAFADEFLAETRKHYRDEKREWQQALGRIIRLLKERTRKPVFGTALE